MQGFNDPFHTVETQQRIAYWDAVAQWGYTLWFVAFAIAAGLLLLYVFIPPEEWKTALRFEGWRETLRKYRSGILHAGGVLLLVLCAVSSQTEVDQTRGFVADQDKRYAATLKKLADKGDREAVNRAQYMYMPKGKSLLYMSLGNPNLAADYLWLTSQQYVVNTFRRGQKYEMLLRFYETMLELDPHWIEAEVNAGKILSALETNRYAVEKYYQEAISQNPESVELFYEAGRLFIVPPVDLDLRQEYAKHSTDWLKRVIEKLSARPQSAQRDRKIKEVADLISRMAVETDRYELAVEMLEKNMNDPNTSKTLRQISARDWLNAKSMVIVSKLQKYVDEFKAQHFGNPLHLGAYIEILRQEKHLFIGFDRFGMPRDAYGFPIEYDAMTGKVMSRGVTARMAIQTAAMVNAMIGVYRYEHSGVAPQNLNELQQFVREFYGNPLNPPTSAMTSALGMDLNVITNPFGKPWVYNAAEGKVELPPECNAKALFKNAERLVPQD